MVDHCGFDEDYDEAGDAPDVSVSPLALFIGIWGFGLFLDWATGASFGSAFARLFVWPGAILLGLGGLVAAGAAAHCYSVGTSLSTLKPCRRLLTNGLFAYSRNPIYLGGLIATLGLGLRYDAPVLLILLPLLFLGLHYGTVLREEAYLRSKFDTAHLADYATYSATVNRWFGRRSAPAA